MENNDSQLIYEQYRTITEQKRQNPVIDKQGSKFWYNDRNELHREDGPAIEWFEGSKEWWINHKRHREDGPAIENSDGGKWWYINHIRHREDGPAFEHANGGKMWYINDELHREDGPAIERADGTKVWYINGKLHREDGPAYEWADGSKEWFINGEYYKSIPEWAAALFEYKGWTREALKNKGRDYNTLLNAVIGMVQSKYGK